MERDKRPVACSKIVVIEMNRRASRLTCQSGFAQRIRTTMKYTR